MSRHIEYILRFQSPSMRREWIEMIVSIGDTAPVSVSLHAEGVD